MNSEEGGSEQGKTSGQEMQAAGPEGDFATLGLGWAVSQERWKIKQVSALFIFFPFLFVKVRFLIFLWVGLSRWGGRLRVEGEQTYLEGMPMAMPFHCQGAEEAHCGLGRCLSVKVQGSG